MLFLFFFTTRYYENMPSLISSYLETHILTSYCFTTICIKIDNYIKYKRGKNIYSHDNIC